ncbi:MAG TPA: P-loop NTPase fold protein [Pseudonocardiaceae bacterium]|nr:P-loop NTPase fold protein [Pseudonocardiaceae bacterium]
MADAGAVRVRDIDPAKVLASGSVGPYLPRDVDTELDDALAVSRIVVLAHGHASGARRSAYEALRRNVPDALLYVDPDLLPAASNLSDVTIVMWVDIGKAPPRPAGGLDSLFSWARVGSNRRLLVIVSEDGAEWRGLVRGEDITVVRMSARLSDQELADAATRVPNDPFTIEEYVDGLAERSSPRSGADPDARRRHAADYRADTDDGDDRLGITADVEMLADLVASRLIEPPLSIGLFGNWGSGKSFFMRRMRDRVRTLESIARTAEQAAGRRGAAVSSYCSAVRQITFNAWHYAEANLWASLATHIFDNLAAGGSDDDLRRRADDLAERRHQEDSLLDQLSTVRMERLVLARRQEQQAAAARRPAAVAKALLDKLTDDDRSWIAAELGVDEPQLDDARRFADEFTGTVGQLRALGRDLRRDPVPHLVLGAGVVAVLVLAGVIGWTGWSGLAGGLAVAATVATGLARARAALARIRRTVHDIDAGGPAEQTGRRIAALDGEEQRLSRAVAELATTHDVTTFAESRQGSDEYRQHLGVVSALRRDLTTFAAMLARERDAARQATDDTEGEPAGIERIVLYVDDLDRCPPTVVIQVLEAIHLLLALPVFVVVVGVDARWLTRAIRQHYATMLDASGDWAGRDDALAANYLEKIFQIPFALSPMGQAGFNHLIRGLSASAPGVGEPARPAPGVVSSMLRGETLSPSRLPGLRTDENQRPTVRPAGGLLAEPRPERLEVYQPELAFLECLAPLVSSPRAAKRLINLYRLVRARLSGAELDAFLAFDNPNAPYRAVLVLLAALVGHPGEAPELFRVLGSSVGTDVLPSILRPLQHGSPLHSVLARLIEGDPALAPPRLIAAYQPWLPLVGRFSFA